jgi:hypothetical protein
MRLAFDRAGDSAVRLCIAAAMVIRETCREIKNVRNSACGRPLQRNVNKG